MHKIPFAGHRQPHQPVAIGPEDAAGGRAGLIHREAAVDGSDVEPAGPGPHAQIRFVIVLRYDTGIVAPVSAAVDSVEHDPRPFLGQLLREVGVRHGHEAPRRLGSFAELHGSGYHEREKAPAVMWRTKEWKLVLYLPGEFRHLDRRLDEYHGELYDLAADPGELHNRYDDRDLLSVRERLTRQLLLHMTVAWSRFPRPYSYTDID